MSKTNYRISLKGFVGGTDFDRKKVDSMLAENKGKHVDVLIDSTGGSLATGLSISAAFKNHGDVAVHFVGLNASAATIASLGAKHISIDAGAMYLVHKCSMAFFEWGSLNSDDFSQLIANCEKIKDDLDKLDQCVAQMYASRCKRKPDELLELMKVGGWLSAKEALEWGFVDEITDLDDEAAPTMTGALASAMANVGMPIPNIPVADKEKETSFGRFLSSIASLFKQPNSITNKIQTIMKKTYKFLCALLGVESLELIDNAASLTDDQLTTIDLALQEREELIEKQKKEGDSHKALIEARDKTIAELQAKLDAKPGDETTNVVDDKSAITNALKSEAEMYCDTVNSATKLFNMI